MRDITIRVFLLIILYTLYPPFVSPAFLLASTHFILKKNALSLSYSSCNDVPGGGNVALNTAVISS